MSIFDAQTRPYTPEEMARMLGPEQPDYKSAWKEEFEFINSLYKGRHSKYVINVISKRQELEQKYNLKGEQNDK